MTPPCTCASSAVTPSAALRPLRDEVPHPLFLLFIFLPFFSPPHPKKYKVWGRGGEVVPRRRHQGAAADLPRWLPGGWGKGAAALPAPVRAKRTQKGVGFTPPPPREPAVGPCGVPRRAGGAGSRAPGLGRAEAGDKGLGDHRRGAVK